MIPLRGRVSWTANGVSLNRRSISVGNAGSCGGDGMRIQDQPPPKKNQGPAVWDLVVSDMRERDRIGRERYGTPLQAHNGRDALVDAYQEALDLCVYLRQAILERDGK